MSGVLFLSDLTDLTESCEVEDHCFDKFEDSKYLQYFGYYIEGVLLSSVCVAGILANTLTIIVLSRYDDLSSFNKLLISLAVSDLCLLSVFLVDSGLPMLDVRLPGWYAYLVPAVHSFKHMTITGSIYMVVVISVERYRAFLHPFEKHFNWLHLVLFTSSTTETGPAFTVTRLGENKTYMKWSNYWDQLFLNGLLPFLVLFLANFRICSTMTESETTRNNILTESCRNSREVINLTSDPLNNIVNTHRGSTTESCRVRQKQILRRRREKSNLVLTAIIVVFLCSQSIRLAFKMIELSLIEDHVSVEVFTFCARAGRHGVPSYLICISYFNHILLAGNSATNFFLYCLVAEKFRYGLKSLMKSLTCR